QITLSQADPDYAQKLGADPAAAEAHLDQVIAQSRRMIPPEPPKPGVIRQTYRDWNQALANLRREASQGATNLWLKMARTGEESRAGAQGVAEVFNPVPGSIPQLGLQVAMPFLGATGGRIAQVAKTAAKGATTGAGLYTTGGLVEGDKRM